MVDAKSRLHSLSLIERREGALYISNARRREGAPAATGQPAQNPLRRWFCKHMNLRDPTIGLLTAHKQMFVGDIRYFRSADDCEFVALENDEIDQAGPHYPFPDSSQPPLRQEFIELLHKLCGTLKCL